MSGQDTRLLLFGGKGGVGKTTCSAAVAVALAARGVRTLHLTSDAAPSLADIYRVEIGGTTTPILPALDAMEITQETVARVWKEKFGPDFLHILSHIMDVEGMLEEGRLDLLDYIGTAPALREETLLDMVREMAEGGRYQRIIWDTAPAGETLKLLGMPKLMRQHLRAGARVYEAVDRLAGMVSNRKTLATVMEEWVLRSEQLASFLVERTRFFIVANPEALVVHQAERMLLALREAGLTTRASSSTGSRSGTVPRSWRACTRARSRTCAACWSSRGECRSRESPSAGKSSAASRRCGSSGRSSSRGSGSTQDSASRGSGSRGSGSTRGPDEDGPRPHLARYTGLAGAGRWGATPVPSRPEPSRPGPYRTVPTRTDPYRPVPYRASRRPMEVRLTQLATCAG